MGTIHTPATVEEAVHRFEDNTDERDVLLSEARAILRRYPELRDQFPTLTRSTWRRSL